MSRHELITSTANPTVKRIRALRQRKARDESGQAFVEGIRIVGEAVALNVPLEMLVTAPALLTSTFARQTVAEAQAHGVSVLEVSPAVFESFSGKDNPQGIGALVRQTWTPLESVEMANHPGRLGWVALYAAQDPGNIGTVLRTCDAVGADGLILLDECADPYDPSAARASMGALFGVKLARARMTDFLAWKARHSVPLIGTSDAASLDYREAAYPLPAVLLMGSERQGLPPQAMAACDLIVSLPMRGRGDSLNLAVATGVMLYALLAKAEAVN